MFSIRLLYDRLKYGFLTHLDRFGLQQLILIKAEALCDRIVVSGYSKSGMMTTRRYSHDTLSKEIQRTGPQKADKAGCQCGDLDFKNGLYCVHQNGQFRCKPDSWRCAYTLCCECGDQMCEEGAYCVQQNDQYKCATKDEIVL